MSALLEAADGVVRIAVEMCDGMEENAGSDCWIASLNTAIEVYQQAAGPYREGVPEFSPIRSLPTNLLDLDPGTLAEARAWLHEAVRQLVAARGEDAPNAEVRADRHRLRQILGAIRLLTEDQS